MSYFTGTPRAGTPPGPLHLGGTGCACSKGGLGENEVAALQSVGMIALFGVGVLYLLFKTRPKRV
jgi:hypothetical protein